MSTVSTVGRVGGWGCILTGALQMAGGTRIEPGMRPQPTVDSHVRYMGSTMVGYGLGWLAASRDPEPDLGALRTAAGLMALGGASRLITRVTLGRPHRFHDVLMTTELAAPVLVEVARARDRRRGR